MKQTNKIKKIVGKIDFDSFGKEWEYDSVYVTKQEMIERCAEDLVILFTEMVEGELKQFVDWVEFNWGGFNWTKEQVIKQYLAEGLKDERILKGRKDRDNKDEQSYNPLIRSLAK